MYVSTSSFALCMLRDECSATINFEITSIKCNRLVETCIWTKHTYMYSYNKHSSTMLNAKVDQFNFEKCPKTCYICNIIRDLNTESEIRVHKSRLLFQYVLIFTIMNEAVWNYLINAKLCFQGYCEGVCLRRLNFFLHLYLL